MTEKSSAKSIYTTHEVSRLLQVNPRSVINWIDQDLLSSYRTPGGHRRIRHDDLLAFLRKHQIPTPSELIAEHFSILLVDDDEESLETMKTYFERNSSYTLRTASDSIAALIEVGRAKPDLMILDITIPGVNGLDICRSIKGDSTNKTAIIAIGNQANQSEKLLEAGADGFLTTPLDLAKLLGESKRLLRVL